MSMTTALQTANRFSTDFKKIETVGDLIRDRRCLTFYPRQRVQGIIRSMHGNHSGAAAVKDHSGRFIGLITEREILRRLFQMKPETEEQERFAEADKPIMDLTAWDIMIASPDCLEEEMDIEEALDLITAHGYRHMPVVRRKNREKIKGIVNERELFIHAHNRARHQLESKDTLLSYFMHHEPYGVGVRL